MIKYVKLYNQFCDFVKFIAESSNTTDVYEHKLVNLILEHFDEIAEVGTAHGKRATLLNTLIQKHGMQVSSSLPTFEEHDKKGGFPLKALQSLEVEHFRGFSRKEPFTFDKSYTFIYGPNGSGKSSFCEALEYSLLGYIGEAISRRIDINQYIRNGFTGKGKKPKLVGVSGDGKEMLVQPDTASFHFCFIEKNRIEDFGRISANTPNDKQNLLAALFGLSEFNDFVANFTKKIDDKIDTVGKAQEELKNKSAGIKVHKENIETAKQRLLGFEQEKMTLVKSSGHNLDFDDLDKYIHGWDGKEGRVVVITKMLATQGPKAIALPACANIDNALTALEQHVNQTKALHECYVSNRDKVNFRSLFAAIIEIQKLSPDKCPVCETPVDQATKHPFENAKTKLKELEEIAKLETQLSESKSVLRVRLEPISKLLQDRCKACEELGQQYPGPQLTPTIIDGLSGLPSLIADFELIYSQWQSHKESNQQIDAIVAKHNAAAQENITKRDEFEKKHKQLSQLSKSMVEIKSKCTSEPENLKLWQKEIDEFQKNNAVLIKEAIKEKTVVDENKKFVTAYNAILNKLNNYKDQLPVQHLKELNTLTVEIYNLINDGDPHFEKVAHIALPKAIQDPIRIFFADKPQQPLDALHILSEGHIRCLGLSILLAKNIHEKCPLVIFDDVVNAIDDTHRGGVRNVVFTDKYMSGKQIILTTHAEQFVKELEPHLTKADYDKLVRKLSFYADLQDRLIRIKGDAQQNYLHKIEKACTEADWGEALYCSRCCLESLSHKLWKRLSNKNFKTEFTVVIRSPNGIPDLMSVVSSLAKFLEKYDTAGEFTGIRNILKYFLGLETASNIIWQYLNKGTHEQEGKPEFDHSIVKNIAGKLLELDTLVKA